MQKVAVIYHFFPHYRSGIIKELLKSNEYEFHFFGDDIEQYQGIKRFKDIPDNRFHVIKFTNFKGLIFQHGLIKLATDSTYSKIIILADPHFVTSWPLCFLGKLLGRKIIYWTHGWTRNISGLRYFIKKKYHNLADDLLLYGNRAKELAIQTGYPEKNCHVIYNSLDYENQLEARNKLASIDPETNRMERFGVVEGAIVTVARLIESCRFDLLIQSLKLIKEQHNLKPKVIIIGEGPEKNKLQILADELDVADQIMFMGPCYDETVLSEIIYAADVTVSPGKVGLLAMHSLNYGTPVITHDNFEKQMPEYEAIIPNKTGSFFKHNDPNSLAEEIITWINNKKDARVIEDCHSVIDNKYNPLVQSKIIHEVLNDNKQK
ncbi:TPA: glycosyltransferase family 4 protein [Raoultella planticola]